MEHERVLIPQADLDRQREFEEKIRGMFAAREAHPVACVDTFGCQQNVADGQKLMGMLEVCGFTFTQDPKEADLVILNTCAVREHAEDRVFGNLGILTHTKKENPEQVICLCGCMAQEERVSQRIKKSYPHVDLVFGPHALWRFPELLYRLVTRRGRIFDIADEPGSIAEGIPLVRQEGVKAWVSIMYGCNNFCTYCIVPYVRGRERSRQPEVILDEIRGLVAEGYKDITLLGQNVNSYGKDLDTPCDFADLLKAASEIPGDFLLRFMTSHPKDASQKLFDTMASSPKIAPCFHLPFQAGSDRVLKAMNRVYDRAGYLDKVRRLRAAIPDVVITSDVIVGFPGETYEEFQDTLSLIREVGFTSLFTFIYSPREGTRAAKMPDPVSHEEKTQWFAELLKVQEEVAAQRSAAMVGQTYRVLVEERNEKSGLLSGRTASSVVIDFPGAGDGEEIPVGQDTSGEEDAE